MKQVPSFQLKIPKKWTEKVPDQLKICCWPAQPARTASCTEKNTERWLRIVLVPPRKLEVQDLQIVRTPDLQLQIFLRHILLM